jgi:hypothetical protein
MTGLGVAVKGIMFIPVYSAQTRPRAFSGRVGSLRHQVLRPLVEDSHAHHPKGNWNHVSTFDQIYPSCTIPSDNPSSHVHSRSGYARKCSDHPPGPHRPGGDPHSPFHTMPGSGTPPHFFREDNIRGFHGFFETGLVSE